MARNPAHARNGALLRRMLVTLVLSALMMLTSVTLAHAHETRTIKSGDGSIARMDDSHQVLAVCDRDPDGHYAYIRETDWSGASHAVYDRDGYGGTCGHDYRWNPSNFKSYLSSYNICVQYEGCGTPVYNGQF